MSKIEPIKLEREYDSLKKLFEDWEKAHKREGDPEKCRRCTFPCHGNRSNACTNKKTISKIKGNFIEDGSLDYNYNGEKNKILFICRESNVSGGEVSDDSVFWMRKQVNEKRRNKYYNCLEKIAEAFGVTSDNLIKCAYMNINKRGGDSECNMTRLRNYSIAYQNYIKEEIRLLKPKNIVILGNLPKETSRIIARNDIKTYIFPKHPSVYGKDEIKEFEKTKEKYLWRDDINE